MGRTAVRGRAEDRPVTRPLRSRWLFVGRRTSWSVDALEDDIARLDTLGRIFGLGLILYNAKNPRQPDFEIRVRAAEHDLRVVG